MGRRDADANGDKWSSIADLDYTLTLRYAVRHIKLESKLQVSWTVRPRLQSWQRYFGKRIMIGDAHRLLIIRLSPW